MTEVTQTSRTARIALWLGIGGPTVTVVGILLSQLGAPPMLGFGLFQLGILLGLGALLCGAVGLFLTRGETGGRRQALGGLGLGVLMVVIVLVGAGPGANVPPINDITTNLDDPPAFAPAPVGHRNADRDMSYPSDWVPLVREAYPDLEPLSVPLPADEAYALALAEADRLGWQVTRSDPKSGEFEAEDATALFRFVDDVSVRVRGDGAGLATIDIRSKSRDGRGDLGTNATRIRAFSAGVLNHVPSNVAVAPES